jgi:hypothetical protein
MRQALRVIGTVLIAAWFAAPAAAEVTRLQVVSRTDVPGYPYERITGRMFFSVDPRDPHNMMIVDLDKAPRTTGRVEFSADVVMLKPKSGGNGTALVDIVNRGRITALGFNKPSASTDREFGDGFLMKRGFAIVAVGWEFDAPKGNALLGLDAPIATDNGRPLTGVVRAAFTPDRADDRYTVTDLATYAPVDPEAADSTLSVRSAPQAAPTPVPRAQWRLGGNVVTLTGGFEPGRIYELAYRSSNPRVGGVGFLAVRDAASWLKHAIDAPMQARHVYAFGLSQSGRFLRDFLYHGCNTDEHGRRVFDAVMIHIAGSSRLDLNRRWGTPVSLGTYTATSFPFADAALRDPVSGVTDGELDNARARANQPRAFYTNTGVEYWGGARAAALLHVTADGKADIVPPPNVRIYFLTGAQHGPAAFPPPAANATQQRPNPTDYWWTLRGLLIALDDWVARGIEPPASAYPKIADGTLVKASDVAFPSIPGVHSPRELWGGARIANPLVAREGGAGTPLPLLVPQVDADGNERAGVRLPEIVVPLATYTGWNFRDPVTGGPDMIRPLIGSYIPFPATRDRRAESQDPRRSIDERYASRDAYLASIRLSAQTLAQNRYVLMADVAAIVARALDHWSLAAAPVSTATASR